jgi:hypothetical protein
MIRINTLAGGTVLALAMLLGVGGVACAAPGSVSARSGISPLPSAGPPSSATPAPPSSSPAPPASPALSSDPGLGDTRPPCPFAQSQLILGPNASPRPGTDVAIHKPFSDVGVDFGPPQPGATIVSARLDVVVTDATPLPIPDPASPQAYESAEAARPDSFAKLTAGTEAHVARVTLKPFAQGPFVLRAAVLNALPGGVASYTVYLVESVDESVCYGATPDPSRADSGTGSGHSVIAELVP